MAEILHVVRDVPSPAGPVLDALRAAYRTGITRSPEWRRAQLQGLRRFLEEEEEAVLEALHHDLGRGPFEAWTADVGTVRGEIDEALSRLDRWMAPRSVSLPLALRPGSAVVDPMPRGVVAILAPWNYPFYLLLGPLVSALAAGNCAVLKPSEHAPASAALVAGRLAQYVDGTAVKVLTGGPDVARDLLDHPLDLVVFTGSTAVGRQVMMAAARNLTPVVLELGGKSPALVDATADLRLAARRIAWGRFLNAGQTCVAPDHVLVEEAVASAFRAHLLDAIREMYGPDPARNPDYGRIVHAGHLERLRGLLEGQEVVWGGDCNPADLYLAPTVVWNPSPGAPILQEEIFGPILPLVPVRDLGEALRFVEERPDPLAVYLFTRSDDVERRVRAGTRSGALVVNDVVVHLAAPDVPFGGVGASGMGALHGRAGFETMSHLRPVIHRSTRVDPSLRYPPYTGRKLAWARRLV